MSSEERFFVSFEHPPAHRYFVAAWMFLEDAADRGTRESNPMKRVFQLKRLLGPCASNLRMACEAHFGNLNKVPDPALMWFVTAARHIASHAVNDPGLGVMMHPSVYWDDRKELGSVEGEGILELDLAKAAIGENERRLAAEYLARHEKDLFLALHAAAETIAGWIGERIDDDFRALRTRDVGRFRVRLPIKGRDALANVAEIVAANAADPDN